MINALFVPSDLGGCGYYRLLTWQRLMQLSYGEICPLYMGPLNLVNAHQDVTITQRIIDRKSLQAIVNYKAKNHTRFIIDYDDLLWQPSDGKLHNYNVFLQNPQISAAEDSLTDLLAEAADLVTVSCETLKTEMTRFIPADRIVVIPNYLTANDWWFDKTVAIPSEDTFFYSGSMSHYNNEKKQYGDFDIPLAKFLSQNKTLFQGDQKPWFFEHCLVESGWTGIQTYAKELYNNTRYAKFTLAPLQPNVFNTMKSDLKYLESCAIGRVCLVSDFVGSPYTNAHPMQKLPQNASIGEIKDIVDNAKAHYGEILEYQYDYLSKRWADDHIDEYTDVVKGVL